MPQIAATMTLPLGERPTGDKTDLWFQTGDAYSAGSGTQFNTGNLINFTNAGQGLPNHLGPGSVYTTDEQKLIEQQQKEKKEKTKAEYDAMTALMQMTASALGASDSLESLGLNLARGFGGWLNTTAQSMMPGPGGMLMGGLLQFGVNMLIGKGEQALPIEDNAVRMILVNPRDIAIEMAAVRDSREIAFSSIWQQSFTDAARSAA